MNVRILHTCLAFLTASLLLGCAGPKNSGSQKLARNQKKIDLQLYSVRDDIKKDFTGTIEQVGKIGFTGVEAAGYSEGKFYNLTPVQFKSAIEKNGMTVLSSHTGKALDRDISKTNWEATWKWWDQCIADHKAAGMKYIVVPSMPAPKTLADLKAYCDYFNQIGERCNKQGIRFGYHNHSSEFNELEGQRIYDFMLKNTDPSKVFFEMDVYWVVRGGQSPVEYFEKYPGRFEILHIKDHKELGQSGMVGFDAIFRHAAVGGMKHAVVEVEAYNFTPIESIRKSYDYLINLKEL